MQSHSSYATNLSTLSWLLCAPSNITAPQDVPAHTVLIGGAEWSGSFRYTVEIRPQLS